MGADLISSSGVVDLTNYANGTVQIVSPASAGRIRVAVASAVTRTLSDAGSLAVDRDEAARVLHRC